MYSAIVIESPRCMNKLQAIRITNQSNDIESFMKRARHIYEKKNGAQLQSCVPSRAWEKVLRQYPILSQLLFFLQMTFLFVYYYFFFFDEKNNNLSQQKLLIGIYKQPTSSNYLLLLHQQCCASSFTRDSALVTVHKLHSASPCSSYCPFPFFIRA